MRLPALFLFAYALVAQIPAPGGGVAGGGSGGGTPGGSTTQVQYNNAGVFGGMSGTAWTDATRSLAFNHVSLGVTPTDSLTIDNTTAAAAGAQQISPRVKWCGNGWKTDATAGSQQICWTADVLPTQGTSAPRSIFRLAANVNTGAFVRNMQIYFDPADGSYVSFGPVFDPVSTPNNWTLYNSIAGNDVSLNSPSGIIGFYLIGARSSVIDSAGLAFRSNLGINWSNSPTEPDTTKDTGLARNAAGIVEVNNGTAGTFRDLRLRTPNADTYASSTNCSSSAAPAVCAAAPAGSVTIAAAGTTKTVNTTAVTANSQIFIQEDSSLGTKLGVTCNTTTGRDYTVTTRTAATSFVITSSAAPTTNPACLSYFIVN